MNIPSDSDLSSPSGNQAIFKNNKIFLMTPSQPTYMTSPFYDRATTANEGIRLHSRSGVRGIKALPLGSPTGKLHFGSTNKAKISLQALFEERSSNFYDLTSQKAFPARFFNINPEGKELKEKVLTNLNHCLDSRRLGTSQKRLNVGANRYSLGMTQKIDQTPNRTPFGEKSETKLHFQPLQGKPSTGYSSKISTRKILTTSLEVDGQQLPIRDQITPLSFTQNPGSYQSFHSSGRSTKGKAEFKGSFLIRNIPILTKPVSKSSKIRNS